MILDYIIANPKLSQGGVAKYFQKHSFLDKSVWHPGVLVDPLRTPSDSPID